MKSPLCLVLILLATLAATARATDVGLTAFGGSSVSIVQDDNKGGATFGVRVPIGLASMITLEPFYQKSSAGTVTRSIEGISYTRSGFDVRAFGVNLALGSPVGHAGFKFFPYGGIGSYKLTRVGSEDISETGYSFGLAIGVAPTHLISVIARGEGDMIKTGDTSRKFAAVTVGLSYALVHSK